MCGPSGPALGADTRFGKTRGKNGKLRRLGKVSAATGQEASSGQEKGPGQRKVVTVESRVTPFVFGWRFSDQACSPGGSDREESTCNAGDPGSIPRSGRSPGEGNGHPFQYSCLEKPMDTGAWRATVHGITKSPTRLSDSHFRFSLFPTRHPECLILYLLGLMSCAA